MLPRRRETVRLTPPAGEALVGSLSFAEAVGPSAVLYVHGFGSTRRGAKADALEAECGRRGWTFAAFDFHGHGESGGDLVALRGSALQEDLDRVQADLAERGVRRLFLVGSSMGAWAAAWFAVRRPEAVGAAVFLAPAFRFLDARWARLDDAAREQWRRTGRLRVRNEWLDTEIGYGLMEERERFPTPELMWRWSAPLLIFHGMRDDVVRYADSLDFMEKTLHPDVELRLLKDAGHRLLPYADEIAAAACDFFARRGFQA